MKIMHFIHGLNTGGAETLVKNYFLNFDRNKNDVVLLCIYHMKESPYEEILRKAGVRMIFVEDYFLHGMGKVANNFNRIFKYYLIRKIIKRESPDILHTHLPINAYVRFAHPKKNAVVIHTVHSEPKALWDYSKKDRARDLVAAQWLVKHRDMRFIVLHEKMRKEIDEMFNRSDTIVLNNGVDVNGIKNIKHSNRTFRKKLDIPGDAFVLGHIGRLSKVKNQEFLVDIFEEVAKKKLNAFLLMIGDGLDKNKIIKKLNDAGLKDKYLILSNRDDVPDLLNIMDAFVFPSLYEGLPLSLIEAQIARKPCFVSDRIEESAIISNLVTRLSLNDDAEQWADTILAHKRSRNVVVNEDNWDIRKITKKLERIYLDVLAERQDGKSRTKNTTRNIGAGLVNQTISIILPFINRTAILWTLGAEFTGLAGLFSSILNVLNVAELGFNTAVVYSLYKPMADGDHKKICEIVSLFKKIYIIVGTVILLGGLVVMPFLTNFINGSYPDSINLYAVFFLYLINSAISYYLFAYKECLLVADQRQDIAKNIRTIVNIIRYLAQLLILVVFKDFYVYLIVAIMGTVLTNVLIHISVKKRYPFYKRISAKLKIPAEMKKQVGGLVINRICDTFRNSFDSLIISMFIGLTATAIYGNYYYIYSALYGIMLVISSAMSASVGNSIVKNSEETNYKHLLTFSQLYAGIVGFCTVALACFYQPFMKLWAGEELMLPNYDMLLFCAYFYVINMNNIRNQYVSGTGMWWKLKSSYIIEALANLGLNFILGRLFGITGVIVATIITIFLFNYLQRNRILFKHYFKKEKISDFYRQQFYYLALTTIGLIMSFAICEHLPFEGVMNFVVRAISCLTIPNIIYYVGIRYTKQFRNTRELMTRIRRSF